MDTDDTRRMMDDGRRTTPWVWHKLPTGELITKSTILNMGNEHKPSGSSKYL